jgi:hypothetical protein
VSKEIAHDKEFQKIAVEKHPPNIKHLPQVKELLILVVLNDWNALDHLPSIRNS